MSNDEYQELYISNQDSITTILPKLINIYFQYDIQKDNQTLTYFEKRNALVQYLHHIAFDVGTDIYQPDERVD